VRILKRIRTVEDEKCKRKGKLIAEPKELIRIRSQIRNRRFSYE